MESWTYLFSKFSSEALLLEGIAITGLLAGYAAYWVLRKRKHGAANEVIPSGLVKTYLNELIQQSLFLRQQLFGLLGEAGVPPQTLRNLAASTSTPATDVAALLNAAGAAGAAQKVSENPELGQKLTALEQRILQQNQAMEVLLAEKAKLESDLAEVQTSGGGTGAPGTPADAVELGKLKTRVKELEERLAEYSVIEDDLANLKRLQQENAKLKEALGSAGGGAIAAASVAAAAPAPAAEPAAEPVVAPTPAPTAPETLQAAPSEASSPTTPAPSNDEAAFEELAQATQESITQTTPAPEAKAAEKPAEKPAEKLAEKKEEAKKAEAAPAADATGNQKSDEDLLSEFEKMLNM